MVQFDPRNLDPRRLIPIPHVSLERLRANFSGAIGRAEELASDLRNQIHPNTLSDENISIAFRNSDAKEEIHKPSTNVVILRNSALDNSNDRTKYMITAVGDHLSRGKSISGYLEIDPYKQSGTIAAALADPRIGFSDINAAFTIDHWTQTLAKGFMGLTGARDVVVGFRTIPPADAEEFPSKSRFPHLNGFRSIDRSIIPVKCVGIIYGSGMEVAKESGVTRGRLYVYCNELLDRREEFEKLERRRNFDAEQVGKLKERYLESAQSESGVVEGSFQQLPSLTGIWLKGEALFRSMRGECEPYGAGADNGFGNRNGAVIRIKNSDTPLVLVQITERRYAASLYKDPSLYK